MRVKVGNDWFQCEPNRPLMVELSDSDKANIAAMHDDATLYAVFDDSDQTSAEEKLRWMKAEPTEAEGFPPRKVVGKLKMRDARVTDESVERACRVHNVGWSKWHEPQKKTAREVMRSALESAIRGEVSQ